MKSVNSLVGVRRAFWILMACYVAARVLLVAGRHSTREHPDTASYFQGVSLLGSAPRTWVAPLLFTLPESWVIVVQAAISGVAFVTLAVALATLVRDRRVRVALMAIVLLMGLTPRVTYWDTMLLSESLAISMTALLIAAVICIDRVPWPAFAVVFALWIFTRDGHTYLGAMLLIGLVWHAWKHRRVAIAVACAAVLVWNVAAANNNRMVEGSTATAGIAYYSWQDVDTFKWFRDRGMPTNVAWTYGYGGTYEAVWLGLYDDPEFRDWADHHGQALYFRYLLSHRRRLVERMPLMFVDGGMWDESMVDHTAAVTTDVPGVTWPWPNEASWYAFGLVCAVLLSALLLARAGRLDRGRWLLPALLAASSVPHAWMASLASPYEYARHGVVMAFVLVIACWWMIALAVDEVVVARTDAQTVTQRSRPDASVAGVSTS